jgi:acetyl-CoA C-acetyltransferase
VRTPIASFRGALAKIQAVQLAAFAMQKCLERTNFPKEEVNEVILGNVLQAATGQAPSTQALIYAGLPNTIPATTINKVCASGMKSIMMVKVDNSVRFIQFNNFDSKMNYNA